MTKLAKERKDVCLLSGDIGNRMFDHYKEVAPTRFLNCGIAEANMMSMAAGMALSGLRPVVYTITPFTTTRCLEQIRTGVAYHEAPVVIVGTGSGLSYAELGATHHSLEDLAILRSIPNLQVCAPVDSLELEAQLRQAIDEGKPTLLKQGKKYLLLGIGPIISEALHARTILEQMGIQLAIASMGSVKPLDQDFLEQCIKEGYSHWISMEEHHQTGGLGSALLEWLSDKQIKTIELKRMGIGDHFVHQLGAQDYVREVENLNASAIVKLVQSL